MRRWKILWLLLLLIGGAHAEADELARAKAAYRKGSAHYRLGEYADALTQFKEAYRNREDPSFLYNIAQCERQLGHKAEAERMYTSYLRTSPDAPNRVEVEKWIADLHAEVEAEKRAAVAPPPPTPAPVVVAVPAPTAQAITQPAPTRPIYKRWWLWTVVGGVAVAGLAVGLGVGLTRHPADPTAPTTLGTMSFGR